MTGDPDQPSAPPPAESIVGFGLGSMRKSYYPELRRRLAELERFRTLFDAGNDLILLVGLPQATIVDANLPACRRLGWDRAQLLGRPLADVLAGRDLGGMLAADASGQVEADFRCRGGELFPVELTCRTTPPGPGLTALVVARDITDRRRFERELQAARDKAERASMAKTKFLTAASHDLRQPAQSLTLFTDLLAAKLAGHPDATIVEHLQRSVDALRLLLDGILDLSRMDAGLVVPLARPFAIAPLLAQLGIEYEARARQAGLRLRARPCNARVVSDPLLLERILRNLLENALRYTRRGGILLGCRRRGDRLRIEVWDSGIGLAPEQMDNIFEEFYQAGNPERDRAKGLGLGLAIVERLARLLDHHVTVSSREGRGSRFAVTVPLAITR